MCVCVCVCVCVCRGGGCPQFLAFYAVFGKICPNNRLTVPSLWLAPSVWGILHPSLF